MEPSQKVHKPQVKTLLDMDIHDKYNRMMADAEWANELRAHHAEVKQPRVLLGSKKGLDNVNNIYDIKKLIELPCNSQK